MGDLVAGQVQMFQMNVLEKKYRCYEKNQCRSNKHQWKKLAAEFNAIHATLPIVVINLTNASTTRNSSSLSSLVPNVP